jgi:hypothetical protein
LEEARAMLGKINLLRRSGSGEGRMIYQHFTRSIFFSQIMIKLNIKFDRYSISFRELRSYFDHAPEIIFYELLGGNLLNEK